MRVVWNMAGASGRLWLDRAGALFSFLCGLHCLALPLLFAVAPAVAHAMAFEETTETWLTATVCSVAILSVAWGYRAHRRRAVPLALALALTAVIVARSVGHGTSTEAIAMGVAGLLFAVTHVTNAVALHRH